MFAQRSLLLAAAGAFTLSTVFAHPRGAAHVHQHAQNQDSIRLSYATFYQTQPHGPEGTADIVYTLTSPVWVTGGAAAIGTGASKPTSVLTDDSVPVATPKTPVAPVEPVEASSASTAVPAPAPTFPTLPVEKGVQPPRVTKASSTTAVAQTSVIPQPSAIAQPIPSNSTGGGAPAPPYEQSGSGTASGEHKDYGSDPAKYPASSSWLTFDALLQAQKGTTDSRGMWSNHVTEDQIDTLVKAIKTVAGETGVDDRIILAMVNQESQGVVTAGGGGLMQATGYNPPVDGKLQGVGELCDATTVCILSLHHVQRLILN
jgi:hypothetical protein